LQVSGHSVGMVGSLPQVLLKSSQFDHMFLQVEDVVLAFVVVLGVVLACLVELGVVLAFVVVLGVVLAFVVVLGVVLAFVVDEVEGTEAGTGQVPHETGHLALMFASLLQYWANCAQFE